MSLPTNQRFNQILKAARDRNGDAGGDTTIVDGHLAQMRMFILRQGIEFYPRQDTYGFRRVFLANLIEDNEFDVRLEGVVDEFLIDGKGLFFFRPTRDSYRLMWFSKENYRAYYDANGDLEEVEVIYSFSVRESNFGVGMPDATGGGLRYVKLRVRRDSIVESITNERPSFDDGVWGMPYLGGQSRTITNSLGFIPAVEAFNNMRATGMDATGEFERVSGKIAKHDQMCATITANLEFFGTPTLLSSRPKADLVESGAGGEENYGK